MKFVILFHETPRGDDRPSHWDLMWEEDDESPLTTFAIYGEPAVGQQCSAEPLAAHRREYLQYEGEVSGGRGVVTRVHSGEVDIIVCEACRVELRLQSATLSCSAVIAKLEEEWQAHFLNPRR